MPYTDEEKRNILQNAGYDPSQYDYDEGTGNVLTKAPAVSTPPTQSPETEDNLSAPKVSSQANQFTPLETGWMHAKAGIAPTLGGFGGALAGAKIPGPWPVKLVGGVAGGLLGSFGTGKAQEQVLTPQFQQDLAASQQQNPKSAFTGDLVPSLLGMSPGKSIKEIPTLLSALRKSPQVLKSGLSALEAAEQNALINASINSGVGAGVNIAEQNNPQNKEPFSFGQLAAHALIPALTLSEPNRLGKLAGFHGTSDIRSELAERNLAKAKEVEAARQNIAQQEDNAATIPSKTLPSQEPTPGELRLGGNLPSYELGENGRRGEFVRSRDPVDINTFEGEGGAVDKTEVQHEMAMEKAKQDLIEQQKVKAELDRQEASRLAQENTIRNNELRRAEEARKPKIEKELTPEEQAAATDYDKQYSEKPVSEELTPDQKLQLDLEQRRLAGLRGIKVEDKSVIHHETGVPQAGVNIQEARLARKSPELGGDSTINHEVGGHGYPNDLLTSTDPKDQALAQKGVDIFKTSADPKEELAKHFEAELYKRQKDKLFGNKATKFKNYMSDVKAHVKSKFGLATDAEVLQHLMSRYEGDAPFGTRFEVGNPRIEGKPIAGTQQYQTQDNPDWHKQVDEMHNATAPRIMELAQEKGLTQRSIDTGLGVKNFEEVQKLERNKALAEENFNKTMEEYRGGNKDKLNELSPLAQKIQYFSEAIQAAKGEGGIGEHLKKTMSGYEPPASRMYSEKALTGDELQKPYPAKEFYTTTEGELDKDRPFGMVLGKDKAIPRMTLESKLARMVPKDELAVLREQGLDSFLKGKARVNMDELSKWVQENGPKLEVKKLEAGEVFTQHPLDARRDVLQHELETALRPEQKDFLMQKLGEWRNLDTRPINWESSMDRDYRWGGLTKGTKDKIKEFIDLDLRSHKGEFSPEKSDSATANYTMVNPKSLSEMPGAVDILVRVPVKQGEWQGYDKKSDSFNTHVGYERPKFEGHHFGDSDKNIVGWVRGYMETNPTTGEKTFHVFEVQSDWAQRNREFEAGGGNVGTGTLHTDPSLNYYEHLALKAAIRHAVEEGATHIAVSDAETAMMTERHDRGATVITEEEARGLRRRLERGELTQPQYTQEVIAAHARSKDYEITQEPGMRQHYDQSLPNILTKLTGSKPIDVSFGEHQNAKRLGTNDEPPLIFKNADGTPKTDITAKSFPLDKIAPIVAQRPAQMFSRQYSSKPIEPGTSIPVMRSEVEKIARLDKGSVNGPVIARGASNFYEGLSRFKGKLVNTPIRAMREASEVNSGVKSYITQDNPDLQAVRDYVDDKAYGVAPKTLTAKQQSILDILRKDNVDVRDTQKTYPSLRQPKGYNEDYNRPVPARGVIDTIMNKPSSPEGVKLIRDFIDYQKATNPSVHTDAQAIAELETFKAGFDKPSVDIAKQFGPIDKAEGVGIPRSWLEPNFLERMSRYGERVARRFAYHESIESQPAVMDALNKGTSGLRAADPVRVVFNNISGIRPKSERVLDAFGGVTRAFMLGPLTGLKDITAGQFLGWQHQTPIQAAKLALARYDNFRANRLESFDQGVNREAIGSLEGSDDISAIVRRIRDLGYTFSGRGIMEQVSRTVAYTEGKWLTMDNFENFRKGDASAQGKKFLNDFGPDDWQTRKTPLTPQEIKDTASRYVESVQGSYDFRGLPAFTQEGSLSPVLALARWNIEKTNNFMKYVITPAVKEGNFTPLLMSTLGAVIGGAAVQQLTETINGRKQKTPTIEELKAANDAGASGVASGVAYKLAAYASLSGYAGIVTDLAKAYGDIAFKNKPQTYHNVLVDAAANIGSTLMDAAQAIQDGAGIEVLADAIEKILEDNIQAYRIVINHPELYSKVAPEKAKTKTEDMQRQDKLRDLRTFKGLFDYPIGDSSSAPNVNAFENQDIKRFKHTSDPAEAIALYPKLIQKAIADAKGDPEKLKSALQNLKANSYQTMPKPENNPLEFTRYMSYLRASQGDSVALSRLADWAQQNSLNKAKTGMIP